MNRHRAQFTASRLLAISGTVMLCCCIGLCLVSGCAAAAPQIQVREERDEKGVLLHTRSYYLEKQRGDLESVLHGAQVDWFPDGKKQREVKFLHGVRHGRTVEWDTKGNILREEQFVDGEKVTTRGPVTKILGVAQPDVRTRFRHWGGGTVDYEQLYDAKDELVGVITRSNGVNVARCIRSNPDDEGRYHRSYWAYWPRRGPAGHRCISRRRTLGGNLLYAQTGRQSDASRVRSLSRRKISRKDSCPSSGNARGDNDPALRTQVTDGYCCSGVGMGTWERRNA